MATEWSQYRGPNLDGTTGESLSHVSAFDPDDVEWRVPVANGFSSFVAGDGMVFTLVARESEGIERETLIALDAKSGDERWHRLLSRVAWDHDGGNSGAGGNTGGDGPRSTPAYDAGHVYVTDNELVLWCIDARSGAPVWRQNLIEDYGARNIKWNNAASPVLEGDRVLVAGGGSGQAFLAFEKASGRLLWKTGDEAITHATPVVASIHGVRQVIFFTQEGLTALDVKDGRQLWHADYPFSVSTAASPVVFEDIVYCSAGYGVGGGAFRISKSGDDFDAAELWRTPNKAVNHWSTPVCKDGYLYGLFGFKKYGSAPLACYDIRTGKLLWEESGFGPGHVILAGDRLLVLGDAGQLVLASANPRGYEEFARFDVLDGKCWTTPILSGGRIYARSTAEAVCLVPEP